MSANAEQPVGFEVVEEPEPPPDPGSFRGLYQIPELRNHVVAGLAALTMIFLILVQNGSDIGGLILLLFGAAGLLFRWAAAPLIFLAILLWFLIFPFGLPPALSNFYEIDRRHFAAADLLLAFSVLIYFAMHFRVYGLSAQAMPEEPQSPSSRKKKPPPRRPVELLRTGEIQRLLGLAAGIVILAQVAWLFVTRLEIDVTEFFPFKLAEQPGFGQRRPSEDFPFWYTRLLILVGAGFFGTLLARLFFGYWRLRTTTPAESAMYLQDSGWDETRRERTRVEIWREWRRKEAAGNSRNSQ